MPISLDFPEITDAFRKFLLLPVRQIAHLFEDVSRWLDKRVSAADLLEKASRDLPIVDFEGDAIIGWIDALQARGLAPDARSPGLGERLMTSGRLFLDGAWGNLKTLVEQELILPRLFITLADAVRAIEASVNRFDQPKKAMPDLLFRHSGVGPADPNRRRAGDLWGEAALAYRTVATSIDQFAAFKSSLETAKTIMNAPSPDEEKRDAEAKAKGGAAAAATTTPAPEASLADSLENYGRYLVAGLLILPALPAFTTSFWDAVTVRVKAAVLEQFAGYEASLNKLRLKVIQFFFADLYLMVHKGVSYCFAAQKVLSANLRFFGEAALAYGSVISDALRTWLKDIGDLLNKYIGYVNLIFGVFSFIFDFDIGKVIAATITGAMGPAAGPIIAMLPPLTVGDLMDMGVDAARESARAALWTFTKALQLYIHNNPMTSDSFLSERLDALPGVVSGALKKYPGMGASLAVKGTGAAFPDVFATFFAPGIGAFRDSVNALGATRADSLRDMPGVASVALKIIADDFDAAADDANQAMVSRSMAAIAATANRQAGAAFGEDIAKLAKTINDAKPDPVAEHFEQWLAHGGFALLTEAIPAYFKSARQFWEDRQKRGDEAAVRIDRTSPHILARRALLARAIVKKIHVKATGRPADKSLAEAIAERFRCAVQQSYAAGNLRLELYGIEEA